MNRLIIVGSPRNNGRSAHLAELLFEACIDECPDDELTLAPVSTLNIAPCKGCDACRTLVERRHASDGEAPGAQEADEAASQCAIDDDMGEIYELFEAADELIVVSPLYFAGPPAQLKALLDRLQPYFWTDARMRPKRPATLHVVGEGGDPHGFDPLVGIVRSALSCAGFGLERVLDWVGRIDENGEITAEAAECPLPPLPGAADSSYAGAASSAAARPVEDAVSVQAASGSAAPPNRPVLRVAAEGRQASGDGNQASGGGKQAGRSRQGSSKQGSSKQGRSKQNGKRRG